MEQDTTFTPAERMKIALDQALHVMASAATALESPPLLDNGDNRAELKNLVDVADSVTAILSTYVRCWRGVLQGNEPNSEEIVWTN